MPAYIARVKLAGKFGVANTPNKVLTNRNCETAMKCDDPKSKGIVYNQYNAG